MLLLLNHTNIACLQDYGMGRGRGVFVELERIHPPQFQLYLRQTDCTIPSEGACGYPLGQTFGMGFDPPPGHPLVQTRTDTPVSGETLKFYTLLWGPVPRAS
jgi:hypothetical protein